MNAWDRVSISRSPDRPTAKYYIENIFDNFLELHGDRCYGDDSAIVGGIATLNGRSVTVIGHEKGQTTNERIIRNFGSPHPEGFRKALRLMKQAEKFKRPIVCFVDTQGAFCGVSAEERGQGEAIATNLKQMMGIKTPIISIVIGEGGSGGALALATANEVYMLENAVYYILPPEGFANILWKDPSRAGEASDIMKITAKDLLELNVIEGIIPESDESIRDLITHRISHLSQIEPEVLAQMRYDRFRSF